MKKKKKTMAAFILTVSLVAAALSGCRQQC